MDEAEYCRACEAGEACTRHPQHVVVEELVTAIWLEGAYQIFRSQRLTNMNRARWFRRAGYAWNQRRRRESLH